jgi:hypothetical protein
MSLELPRQQNPPPQKMRRFPQRSELSDLHAVDEGRRHVSQLSFAT